MKIYNNAVYAIANVDGSIVHLLHYNSNGDANVCLYRNRRGAFETSYDGCLTSDLCKFIELKYGVRHNHWDKSVEKWGVLVATHVADELKLTSRDYKRMVRKFVKMTGGKNDSKLHYQD